ncbi:hypothetical protein PCANB_000033 [Pneumocystis canis]|nr:hypothetical protein PCK1_000166 [Pneumocystis canis]KAG5439751.1 hypothetical protein PCANB_000033 [Pneumocystis canis]
MKRGLTVKEGDENIKTEYFSYKEVDDSFDSDFILRKLKKLEFNENILLNEKMIQKTITCHLPSKCMRNPSVFLSFSAYEAHYQQQHCNVCYECGKVFPSQRMIELHFSEVHDPILCLKKERGERIFECFVEKCGKHFLNVKERKQHLISHHFYPKEYHFGVIYTGISSKDTSLLLPKKKNTRKKMNPKQPLEMNSETCSSDLIINNPID